MSRIKPQLQLVEALCCSVSSVACLFHHSVLLSMCLCSDQAVSSRSNPWGKPVLQRRSTKHIPACQPATVMHLQTAQGTAKISGIRAAELHTMTNQELKDTFQLGVLLLRLSNIFRGESHLLCK